MSAFIPDASYALMWCLSHRATASTDAAFRRMEAHSDSAVVPSLWHAVQVEAGNAPGKAVVKGKAPLSRALGIRDEQFHRLDAPVRRGAALDTCVAYQPQVEDLVAEMERLLSY